MVPSVLALDLSLTSTGACQDGETFTIASKHRGMERLEEIRDNLYDYVDEAMPQVVVIEGYSLHTRGAHTHSLGELGGVIRLMLHDQQIPYVDVPPACRAKYATGRGNAAKDVVVSQITHRAGRTFDNNDEADAYVLWAMAMDHYGHPPIEMPQTHRAALTAVHWPELAVVA